MKQETVIRGQKVADSLLGLFTAAKTATSWAAVTLLLLTLAALTVARGRALQVARRDHYRLRADGPR